MGYIAGGLLLLIGGVLELAGLHFWGLDLLIGLCFLGSLTLTGWAALQGAPLLWSALPFGLAALSLVVHLYLNLGG